MERIEIISTLILGSSFVTGIAGWLMGKRKEDIEVALKYQEFYAKHVKDLREEIESLTEKVNKLIDQDNEKSTIIEDQRKTILRWEENSVRLEHIINEERKNNAKLIKQLDK